jgi:hypothetical protein
MNLTLEREGKLTQTLAKSSRIPSDVFLWAALGAIGASLGLQIAGEDKKATFIGQWAPTLLILAMFNKFLRVMAR